jgi:hypothetical protein
MDLREATVYERGKGWCEKTFTVKETFSVRQPRTQKVYEVWESEGEQYWVLLNQQEVDESIAEDKTLVEKILDYSQQDNWMIETYSFNSDYCITKYYPDYFPNVINEGSADLYSVGQYRERVLTHYMHFDNPFKADYFSNVTGLELLPVSPLASENRKGFYEEAIRQHELFSDHTGCYFSDIDPNNFLVDKDFQNIKIIDVCCLRRGHIKDYHNTSDPYSTTWPLKEHRIVGPVWSDSFYKKAYEGN